MWQSDNVNEQSLQRVNAFLAEVATRVSPGETFDAPPGEIAHAAGFDDHLAAARAVRALIARKRLEMDGGSYRLLSADPVGASEPEAIPRAPRKAKRKVGKAATARRGSAGEAVDGSLTYSDVGAATVDRLIELGREVGTLRSSTRTAKEELRDLRQEREEAVRRATTLAARAKDLEGRLEMAEMNLRTLLAASRPGTGQAEDAGPVGDSEMEAILGVLKTGEGATPASVPAHVAEPPSSATTP